jgi:SH3-like domain-containing protein
MLNRSLKRVCTIAIGIGLGFQAISSFALCVKSDKADLRAGPGTSYAKTWEVYRYMPFKALKEQGNWVKIGDLEGAPHWINRDQLTGRYPCAVVKGKFAHLRSGPGTGYDKLGTAPHLASFKIVGKKSDWLKVMDENDGSFWILQSLVWVN